MKKGILSVLFVLLLMGTGYGQHELLITMLTSTPPGSGISFTIFGSGDTIFVDFGDGIQQPFELQNNTITGTVGGSQMIQVYAYYSTIDFLDCSNCNLSDLDVSACSNLHELHCNFNNLSMLDLSQNTLLGGLHCMGNNLLFLDLVNCGSLRDLDCSSNYMNHLALPGSTELTTILCNYNQLSNESFYNLGGLPNLEHLDLTNNPVTELPDLTGLTRLQTIFMDDCSLHTLPNMPASIQTIRANMETLEYLPDLSSLVNLRQLSLEGTRLESIPDMSANTQLESLECASGDLRSIPDLSSHPSVSQLSCRNNKLTFEDLEPNIGVTGFVYSPQDSISFGEEIDTTFCVGSAYTLSASVNGANNVYQWYKDGNPIGEADGNPDLLLSNMQVSDGGAYHCEVTNSVVSGITLTGAVTTIQVYDLPVVNAAVTGDFCNTSGGSIELSPAGENTPYYYYWDNGERTATISDLWEDTYGITIKNSLGCESRDSFHIESNPYLVVVPETRNATCNGSCDGEAWANITGGEYPYTYEWSNGETADTLYDLCAGGWYSVSVTDKNGCQFDSAFYITEPAPINVAAVHTDLSCGGGSDGSIELTVSAGTPPYSYLWSDGSTTEDISGLEAGSYSVLISDATGCSKSLDFQLNEPETLSLQITGTNPSCAGLSDGTAETEAGGGIMPYSYSWQHGPASPGIQNLADGVYRLTVTDDNGCDITDSVRINDPEPLAVQLSSTDPSCEGLCNGSITAAVEGGTGPYEFAWDNGASTKDLSELCSGTYSLTVTDSMGCDLLESTSLIGAENTLLVTGSITDADCSGSASGSIDLTVEGGSTPYVYNWSNGSTEEDQIDLTAGSYEVNVSDLNGCMASWVGQVQETTKPGLKGIIQYSDGRIAAGDADVVLYDASSHPFISVSEQLVQAEGRFEFTGLPAGQYALYVKLENHAMQSYKGVMHSYYDEQFNWQEASVISLSCGQSDSVTMTMFENPAASNGNCVVSGKVKIKNNGTKSTFETEPDVSLFLVDAGTGSPVDYVGTDAEGYYEFTGVAPGVYSIIVDIPGYDQSSSHDFPVNDTTDVVQGMDYEVDMDNGFSIEAVVDPTLGLPAFTNLDIELYPNPAKEFLEVRFSSTISEALTISIFSTTGSQLFTRKFLPGHFVNGAIRLPLEKMMPGSYILRFETDQNVISKKIIVTH